MTPCTQRTVALPRPLVRYYKQHRRERVHHPLQAGLEQLGRDRQGPDLSLRFRRSICGRNDRVSDLGIHTLTAELTQQRVQHEAGEVPGDERDHQRGALTTKPSKHVSVHREPRPPQCADRAVHDDVGVIPNRKLCAGIPPRPVKNPDVNSSKN